MWWVIGFIGLIFLSVWLDGQGVAGREKDQQNRQKRRLTCPKPARLDGQKLVVVMRLTNGGKHVFESLFIQGLLDLGATIVPLGKKVDVDSLRAEGCPTCEEGTHILIGTVLSQDAFYGDVYYGLDLRILDKGGKVLNTFVLSPAQAGEEDEYTRCLGSLEVITQEVSKKLQVV